MSYLTAVLVAELFLYELIVRAARRLATGCGAGAGAGPPPGHLAPAAGSGAHAVLAPV